MKKLILIFSITFVSCAAPQIQLRIEARQIIIDIPDREITIVENDVIDAEKWLRDAWAGKVNKSKSRLIDGEIKRSIQEMTSIPTTEDGIIDKALQRPDFKLRKDRENLEILAR